MTRTVGDRSRGRTSDKGTDKDGHRDRDRALARSIGAAARQARRALGLTQEDTADRIGVSGEFYARIERGNALPSVQTLARISASLGVNADVMLGRVELSSAADLPGRSPAVQPPSDPPEIRRLERRLRRASPGTLRVVSLLTKELERRR